MNAETKRIDNYFINVIFKNNPTIYLTKNFYDFDLEYSIKEINSNLVKYRQDCINWFTKIKWNYLTKNSIKIPTKYFQGYWEVRLLTHNKNSYLILLGYSVEMNKLLELKELKMGTDYISIEAYVNTKYKAADGTIFLDKDSAEKYSKEYTVTSVTTYKSSDGTWFDTLDAVIEHENKLKDLIDEL